MAKFWNECGFRIAFFGIENENKYLKEMPIRIMSYDGGAYRVQIKRQRPEKGVQGEKKRYYPVISVVLNFDVKHKWSEKSKSLKQMLDIPKVLEPYVSDYKINVFDIAFLPREVIDRFKSDFYIVADYYWKLRNEKEYTPSDREIKNVQEVMQMLSAMSGDKMIEKMYNEVAEIKGGVNRMDSFLTQAIVRGKKEAKEEGRQEGKEEGIKALVESFSEVGVAPEVIEEKLVAKFPLSHAEAREKIEKYAGVAV